jgi:hypothetical protein
LHAFVAYGTPKDVLGYKFLRQHQRPPEYKKGLIDYSLASSRMAASGMTSQNA